MVEAVFLRPTTARLLLKAGAACQPDPAHDIFIWI